MDKSTAGLEPATHGFQDRSMSYLRHLPISMRCNKRKETFWNTPTGVIRNRNPAPFRFMRRSNSLLRQSHMFFKGGNATSCKETFRHPIKGTSRQKCQYCSLLITKEPLTTATTTLFYYKSGMLQTQGDFWNKPTAVSGSEFLHLSG